MNIRASAPRISGTWCRKDLEYKSQAPHLEVQDICNWRLDCSCNPVLVGAPTGRVRRLITTRTPKVRQTMNASWALFRCIGPLKNARFRGPTAAVTQDLPVAPFTREAAETSRETASTNLAVAWTKGLGCSSGTLMKKETLGSL